MRFKKAFSAGAALVLVVAALAVSLLLYKAHKDNGQSVYLIGDLAAADRIDLDVTIVRVDAAAQEMSVQLYPTPHGRWDDGSGGFTADTRINTSALKAEAITVRANDVAAGSEIRFTVGGGGMITDYPFDKYRGTLAFSATVGDEVVPMVMRLYNLDAFFASTPEVDEQLDGDGVVAASVEVVRSVPSVTFALFVMVLMLGLALAAATAAFYVLAGRRGLVWSATGLMSAVLFAMIPLRNAVPGAPPIGSVIDFGSFFIAEAVVALSLICTVLVGYRQELINERTVDG